MSFSVFIQESSQPSHPEILPPTSRGQNDSIRFLDSGLRQNDKRKAGMTKL
jgi:hypothetical protein